MKIKLHIYSGRRNPTWVLSESDLEDLRTELMEVIETYNEASGHFRLGFQGITIEPTSEQEDSEFGFQSRQLRLVDPRASIKNTEVKLAKKLLSTAGYKLSDYLKNRVARQMDELESGQRNGEDESCSERDDDNVGKSSRTIQEECVVQALPYNPVFWNNNPTRLENNNCYNYATNCANDTFAQPGNHSGQPFSQFTCSNVSAAAERDGLEVRCNETVYKVALVMTPTNIPIDDQDYHWYRLVENEDFWGHKPGATDVTNLDDSGQIIRDPRTADRGDYTIFCQEMYVPIGTTVS